MNFRQENILSPSPSFTHIQSHISHSKAHVPAAQKHLIPRNSQSHARHARCSSNFRHCTKTRQWTMRRAELWKQKVYLETFFILSTGARLLVFGEDMFTAIVMARGYTWHARGRFPLRSVLCVQRVVFLIILCNSIGTRAIWWRHFLCSENHPNKQKRMKYLATGRVVATSVYMCIRFLW